MNKYEVLEMIGEGTYGVVVKAINRVIILKKYYKNAFFYCIFNI
jgi:hypothetical protein